MFSRLGGLGPSTPAEETKFLKLILPTHIYTAAAFHFKASWRDHIFEINPTNTYLYCSSISFQSQLKRPNFWNVSYQHIFILQQHFISKPAEETKFWNVSYEHILRLQQHFTSKAADETKFWNSSYQHIFTLQYFNKTTPFMWWHMA